MDVEIGKIFPDYVLCYINDHGWFIARQIRTDDDSYAFSEMYGLEFSPKFPFLIKKLEKKDGAFVYDWKEIHLVAVIRSFLLMPKDTEGVD